MTQDLLSYWKPETADVNLELSGLLNHAASNQFHRVQIGDLVWIVTVRGGDLRLLGRIVVGEITHGAKAAKVLGTSDLWEADYHILAEAGSAHAIQDISVAYLAHQLRFRSRTGRDRLVVHNEGVNPQQLQTMRILSSHSARLLEEALSDYVTLQRYSAARSAASTTPQTLHGTRSAAQSFEIVLEQLGRLQEAGKKSPDLLIDQYRYLDRTEKPLNGLCYVLSECMYHLFPGLFTPYRISWGDDSHWFLRFPDGKVLETIAENGRECFDPDSYRTARRRGFCTGKPSKRARKLLDRARIALPPETGTH